MSGIQSKITKQKCLTHSEENLINKHPEITQMTE